MERVGRTLKRRSFRKVILYFLTCCLILNTSLPTVMATPTPDGAGFVLGNGTIIQNGTATNVVVDQVESIINWTSLNTLGGSPGVRESLNFSQGSLTNSAVLNRVSGAITYYNGDLNATDMRIFIVNPAGIVFGDGASINVSQLVASSLNVSNFHDIATDVTSKMAFTDGAEAGSVEIQGVLNAGGTGSLYFVGNSVTNNGSILCPEGLVVMAAGGALQLGQPGSNVIVTLDDLAPDSSNDLINNGTVGENGSPVGKLVLAAGDVWSQAISNVKKVKIASVDNPDLNGISAYAEAASDAVSEVDIEVGGDLNVDYDIQAEAVGDGENNATATVNIDVGKNVFIEDAEVWADASDGATNTAKVRVGARGDVGVELIAENGRARIESCAENGYVNTAETVVFTEGGVLIVDKSQEITSAEIRAKALDGYHTDAYVGICAQDDVMVMAGIGPEDLEGEVIEGVGGHAIIGAEASSTSEGYEAEEPSTATAEVAVISHNGGVAVIDAANSQIQELRTAEIISSASGGETNTAYTGVAAGGDLLDEENPLYEQSQGTGVIVLGIGDFSRAAIVSETIGDYVNTSNTVVCTPSEVVVEAEDAFGVAEIGARAEGDGINTATTQVYAGDVYVNNANRYGEGGIWANAQGWPVVPFLGDQEFILSEYDGDYGYHDLVWVEGGSGEDDDIATLLIRDYSNRQDCPECPPGPCDEPIEPEPEPKRPFVPAAPLAERLSFEISGYPALMNWVAKELGVDKGKIQIWVANTLASVRDIQPYNTLGRLKAAATILQDAGGMYINALAQVVYEFASSTAPPTEEQMASIADAMARNAGANNQYALAGKYLDALAEYVSILSDEMGFSPEEAVQIATERYVGPLTESDNAAVAAYIAARLAAMGG